MKKLLSILAVLFGLIVIGNLADNSSNTNDKINYTVIDSRDENSIDEFAEENETSLPAINLLDEQVNIDEHVNSEPDNIINSVAETPPQTEDEAKEKLEKAKAKALAEYEEAVSLAELEYKSDIERIYGENTNVPEAEISQVDDSTVSDKNDTSEAIVNDISEPSKENDSPKKDETEDDSTSNDSPEFITDSEVISENPSNEKTSEEQEIMESEIDEPDTKETTEINNEPVQDSMPNESEINESSDETESDGKVWIPASGKKYHKKKDCSGMKEPTKVTKDYAISKGYTPCKKCHKEQQ